MLSTDEGASGNAPRTLELKLDGNGVVAPVHRAMRNSLEVIAIALNAISTTDLSNLPRIPGGMMALQVSDGRPDVEERQSAYTNWLLGKGFQDLARAVRESLEEAYLYVEVFELLGKTLSYEILKKRIAAIKSRANKMEFPELLITVSKKLKAPLQFLEEFLSLQRVRNCMEHRSGVVGAKDLGTSGKLKLKLPSLNFYILEPDKTTLIDDQESIYVEKDGTIAVRRTTWEIEYDIGQRIVISPKEFQKIAQGCLLFATDLGSKLPRHQDSKATAEI